MFSKKGAAFLAVTLLIFAGCASSSVTMTVKRTPTMNTMGIRRIAVMPFETSDNSALQREIAQVITTTATSRIQATRHFTMVDPAEIQKLQQSRESIENHVDALFTGKVVTLNVRDYTTEERRYDVVTKQTRNVTVYVREVELAFDYSFRRARDGSIVGVVTKRGRSSSKNENSGNLKTPSVMAQEIVSHRLRTLYQDIAPYEITEKRTLMPEKSKNKDLQNRMKSAFDLVKEQNYRGALNAYRDIFGNFNNFAAAYNAMIMFEALGETDSALAMMDRVYQDTGNPRSKTEIDRLSKVLEEEGLLAGSYADTRSQGQKVAEHAISQLRSSLPGGAKVWIVNKTERGERILATAVVDGITAALINGGVEVVDRNNTRLIEAEQNFHLSGEVSDDDFMSIGNAAGANTLITVEIVGVGSMRRLKVEMMDIARRTRIFTSDTSEAWNL